MLLNFGRPQLAPNIVAAPKSNIDVNAVLGLAPSQYEGLQSVGDTGYFYGDNKMYQPYTPSPTRYYYMGAFNQPVYYNPNNIMGLGSPSTGGISNRWQTSGGAEAGTIYKGDQAFRPVSEDVTGFTKTKGDNDIYTYDPSMAYVYANTPRPKPVPTPNVTSFLSTPTTMATPQGNYGAGRYLSGLLGSPISYGLPNDQTGSDS